MIVIERVEQVEVFVNADGGITIKQGDDHDESLICISAGHVSALCKALRVAAADAREGERA